MAGEVLEPRHTANAQLLCGFIAGVIENRPRIGGERLYKVVALQHPLIVEHSENGNRYRVTVEQISGRE